MFCHGCGKEIADDALVCIGCGRAAKPPKSSSGGAEEKWSFIVMMGLVALSLFIPLMGIIFGALGLTKEEKRGQGAVLLAIGIIMTVAYMLEM